MGWPEPIEDIDTLIALFRLSDVPDAEKKAEEVLSEGNRIIKHYQPFKILPIIDNFRHIFKVVPSKDINFVFSVNVCYDSAKMRAKKTLRIEMYRDLDKKTKDESECIKYYCITLVPPLLMDEPSLARAYLVNRFLSQENRRKYCMGDLDKILRSILDDPGNTIFHVYSPEQAYAIMLAFGADISFEACKEAFEQEQPSYISKIFPYVWVTMRESFNEIVKVVEKDNMRIAFLKSAFTGDKFLMIATALDDYYNFLDEGNFVYSEFRLDYRIRNRYLKLVFLLFNPLQDEKRLNHIQAVLEELRTGREGQTGVIALTEEELNARCASHIAKENLRKQKQRIQEEQEAILSRRLSEGGFSIRGMQFGRDRITYQNQTIGIDNTPIRAYVDWDILNDTRCDFNSLYNRFIDFLFLGSLIDKSSLRCQCQYKHHFQDRFLDTGIHLGSFRVVVTKETKSGRTYYNINNIRIGKKELKEVLTRALCFSTIQEYNAFLRQVQDIPLRAHDILVNGASFTIRTRTSDNQEYLFENIILKVKRDGAKYYVYAGNDAAHIRGGFNPIVGLSKKEYDSSLDLYKELVKYVCDRDKTIQLIKSGRKEYINTYLRAKQLLEETIKKYPDKIKETAVKYGRERELLGLWVKGRMREYFIDKDTLQVFSYPDLQVRCIVDKNAGREVNKTDRLISRILALLNDSLVAGEIHTIRAR